MYENKKVTMMNTKMNIDKNNRYEKENNNKVWNQEDLSYVVCIIDEH